MASTVLEITGTGDQTYTATLTQADDTLVASSIACTERTNGKGIYTFLHTGVQTGYLRASIMIGSVVRQVAHFNIEADDTNTYYPLDAALAANIAFLRSLRTISFFTVGLGSIGTSIVTSALSPAPSASIAGQLVGKTVYFSGFTTTVALRGQACRITASTASTTPTLTVVRDDGTALTASPVSGDIGIIT